jgi:hypothetical protein
MHIVFKHIPKTAGLSVKEILPKGTLFLGHDYYSQTYKHLFYHLLTIENPFVISVVRNPYDRAVSAFYYLASGGNNPVDVISKKQYIDKYKNSFSEFVLNAFPGILKQIHFMPQYDWIYFRDYKLCNFIAKYENLKEDLSIFLQNKELPNLNISSHFDYKYYYDSKTAKIIYKNYRKDFNLFGYDRYCMD